MPRFSYLMVALDKGGVIRFITSKRGEGDDWMEHVPQDMLDYYLDNADKFSQPMILATDMASEDSRARNVRITRGAPTPPPATIEWLRYDGVLDN
jgi:hypothetical protein